MYTVLLKLEFILSPRLYILIIAILIKEIAIINYY